MPIQPVRILFAALMLTPLAALHAAEPVPVEFTVKLETVLKHDDGKFLVYTRRGANNDHIIRHRAPHFMAQVNPDTLRVLRSSEKVIVPERGAELGNFGACPISESESWVTVSEGMFMKDSKQRGADGTTFVAHVLWAKPNRLLVPLPAARVVESDRQEN